MGITERTYRTCTYIAGDWDGDKNAVDILHHWNESNHWGLSFKDVHDLTQSRDSSLNCSIKNSLRARMNYSKTFVLIVGEHTNTVMSGACFLCSEYGNANNLSREYCNRGHWIDNRSYVKTECDMALNDYNDGKIKILVLYNNTKVDRDKCPQAIRWVGSHVAMIYKGSDNKYYWNYDAVKQAFDSL